MLTPSTAREVVMIAAAYDTIHGRLVEAAGASPTDALVVALAADIIGVTEAYQHVMQRARLEVLTGSAVTVSSGPVTAVQSSGEGTTT